MSSFYRHTLSSGAKFLFPILISSIIYQASLCFVFCVFSKDRKCSPLKILFSNWTLVMKVVLRVSKKAQLPQGTESTHSNIYIPMVCF